MSEFKNQTNTVPPSREAVFRLYVTEGLSCKDAGAILGISNATFFRWLQRYGIPVRSRLEARRIAKPPTYTPEALASKQKAAAAMRARLTPESHAKQAEKMRGRPALNKGKPWSEEQRSKMTVLWQDDARRLAFSESRRGENSPRWKGGVKSELNRRLDTAFWRRRRQECYTRDLWTCQDCGVKCKNAADSARQNEHRKKIQAHHLVARRDGGTDDLENLVTLCMSCHHKREALLKERAPSGKPRFLPRQQVHSPDVP